MLSPPLLHSNFPTLSAFSFPTPAKSKSSTCAHSKAFPPSSANPFPNRLRVPWCRGCLFLICNFGLAVSALSLPNQCLRDLVSVGQLPSLPPRRHCAHQAFAPHHFPNSLSTRPPSPGSHHLSFSHNMSNMQLHMACPPPSPLKSLASLHTCPELPGWPGLSPTCVLVIHHDRFIVKCRVTHFTSA